jgi:hypothetical protein
MRGDVSLRFEEEGRAEFRGVWNRPYQLKTGTTPRQWYKKTGRIFLESANFVSRAGTAHKELSGINASLAPRNLIAYDDAEALKCDPCIATIEPILPEVGSISSRGTKMTSLPRSEQLGRRQLRKAECGGYVVYS